MTSRAFRRLVAVGAVCALGGCDDPAPIPGPGTLTAVVVSPNGAEGAAVVSFSSEGVGEIGAVSGDVFSREENGTVTVVVINEPGGELSFAVALADTTQKPVGVVEEVAAPDDKLRSTLAGYALEFRR
jgi:hypothetical protein